MSDDNAPGTAFEFTCTREPPFVEDMMRYMITQRRMEIEEYDCYIQTHKNSRPSTIRALLTNSGYTILGTIIRKLKTPAFSKSQWIKETHKDVKEQGIATGSSVATARKPSGKIWQHKCACGEGWNGNNGTHHKSTQVHKEWEKRNDSPFPTSRALVDMKKYNRCKVKAHVFTNIVEHNGEYYCYACVDARINDFVYTEVLRDPRAIHKFLLSVCARILRNHRSSYLKQHKYNRNILTLLEIS